MCATNRENGNVTQMRETAVINEEDETTSEESLAEVSRLLKELVMIQKEESRLNDTPHDLFDRSCVRLDGVEVYAVISAMTMATSIACIDNYQPVNLQVLYSEGAYFDLIGETIFLLASACGILAGVHSTMVFSLITMYGRTAIGMDKDDEFNSFLKKTGQQRLNGFKTFLASMYAFLVQVMLLIVSKLPGKVKVFSLPVIVYLGLLVHREAKVIVTSASAIFTSPGRRGGYKMRHIQRKNEEKVD